MSDVLPSFRNPPLVESVLGVQFDPLADLVPPAHLGAFWVSLGDPWTRVSQASPLGQVQESFDEAKQWRLPGLRIGVAQDPGPRLQIVRPDNDHMIQIQNGWLVYNWRLTPNSTDYPRYSEVRREFDAKRSAFEAFVDRRAIGQVRPNLWEVTYVNHLDRGVLWGGPEDWSSLLPGLLGTRPLSTVEIEGVVGEWQYMIGQQAGRLHVSLKHARRQASRSSDFAETLILKLTARGSIGSERGAASLGDGLDTGHRAVVTTFAEITSESAHREWGRES